MHMITSWNVGQNVNDLKYANEILPLKFRLLDDAVNEL